MKTLRKVYSTFGPGLTCKISDSNGTKSIAIVRPADLLKGTLAKVRNPNPKFNLETS